MTSIVSSWLFGSDTVKPSPPNPIRAHLPQAPILHPHSLPINDKKEREQTPEEALDALLEQYKTSTVPAASRFNGELDPQREGKPPGVLDLWRHAWFVATKSTFDYLSVLLFFFGFLMSLDPSFAFGSLTCAFLTDAQLETIRTPHSVIFAPSSSFIIGPFAYFLMHTTQHNYDSN